MKAVTGGETLRVVYTCRQCGGELELERDSFGPQLVCHACKLWTHIGTELEAAIQDSAVHEAPAP